VAVGALKTHQRALWLSGLLPWDGLEVPEFPGVILITTPPFDSRKLPRSGGFFATSRV